jgi:isopenicillin-N N-acyltransferase-like protein
MGYAYGSACKQLIGQAIRANFSYYRRYCNFTKATALRLAAKYRPFIMEYAPELEEEIAGIAEGAERSQADILLLSTYYEIMYRYAGGGMGKCTSIALTGELTANGETFVGQTNDEALEPWGESFSRVVYAVPKAGPGFLVYTYPGFPGQMGVNSSGIALCDNALITDQHRTGVPFQVIVREILRQKTIGDAVNAVTRAKRASSVNFLIVDENGEIYDLETTPEAYDCLFASEQVAVHTNHFLSAKLGIKRDLILENLPDTVIRYNRMRRLLRHVQAAKVEDVMRLFKDHVNYPNSICRHFDDNKIPKDRVKTADCMIFSPTRKAMWLARGNPCQKEFASFTMG